MHVWTEWCIFHILTIFVYTLYWLKENYLVAWHCKFNFLVLTIIFYLLLTWKILFLPLANDCVISPIYFSTPKKIEAINMIAKKGNWYWPLNRENFVGRPGFQQRQAKPRIRVQARVTRNTTRTKTICCMALLPFSDWIWNLVLAHMLSLKKQNDARPWYTPLGTMGSLVKCTSPCLAQAYKNQTTRKQIKGHGQ